MASSSKPALRIFIEPTTPQDLPALAESELLAFSGINTNDGADRYSELYAPFRAPLARAGLPPRHWPDYTAVIRKRRAQMRAGVIQYFTARVYEDSEGGCSTASNDGRRTLGQGQVAGLLTIESPRSRLQLKRANRKWTERVLGDYIYPAVDALDARVLNSGSEGWNHDFLKAAKSAQQSGRDAFAAQKECYIMHVLFVHPRFQGQGVGRALVKHACALADSAGTSLYLEASSARAVAFYAAHGFEQTSTLEIHYRDETVPLPVMIRKPASGDPEPLLEPTAQANLSVPTAASGEGEGSSGTVSPGWTAASPESFGERSEDSFVQV